MIRTLTPEQQQRRDALIREADALRRADGSFADDAARATFDQRMAEIDEIDGRRDSAPPATIEAERQRSAAIVDAVHRAGLPGAFATRLIADGFSETRARSAIFDHLASRDEALGPMHSARQFDGEAGAQTVHPMAEALAARYGGPAIRSAEAEQFRAMRPLDMARHCLEQRGVRTQMLAPHQLIQRALHTTGDFPMLLTESGNRLLRQGYDS
jgi:hypothetical protein